MKKLLLLILLNPSYLLAQGMSLEQVTLDIDDVVSLQLSYSLVPNPSNNEGKIALHQTENITVSVHNSLRQMVKSKFVTPTNNSLNLSSLSVGIYFLKVKNDPETHSLKFLKK